jgi:hypothetical protein
VIMCPCNVNKGQWNVIMGQCNVIMVLWNVKGDLECDYGTA